MIHRIFFILGMNLLFILAHVQANNHNQPDHSHTKSRFNASIRGHVIDKSTGNHVPFINITLRGTTLGTATDATGHYTLRNIPAEEVMLVASAVGFKTIEKAVKLQQGRTTVVNFDIEEDAILLDNVVVSANRSETKRRETSTIVNVITPKLFENTNSVCLAQGLNFQPGLRVENNCQNCGFQQVRINGLEGPYSQILIDSRPVFSSLAGVYGIEQIPSNMIERVEVVRGGGSALFGSNAIAGTINIITKEPLANSLTVNHSTLFIGGTSSDINTMFNAAIISDDNKVGVSLYGSTRAREAWDANADGFTEIGLIKARNIGFRSYFRTSLQSKLTLEYHNIGEFRRGGNQLNLPAHKADIAEQTDHNIHNGGLKWEYFSPDEKHSLSVYTSAQQIRRDSYYGAGKDPNAYGLTHDLSIVSGMQYVHSIDKLLFMPANITGGAEYSLNNLTDEQFAYERQINQPIRIAALFAQNEWKTEHLGILLGLRMDKHNLIEKPIFSPRLNVRYSPFSWVNLRTSYAEGFRAPQAFDEDLHLTAVGGDVQIIVNDPALKPENSRSYSVSADFYQQLGKMQANVLIEAFYTDIQDVFYLRESGTDATGNPVLMRKNGSGAVVRGINLEARLAPFARFNLQSGFTIQQSLYKEPESWSENSAIEARREMFRSPNHYGYLTASYNPSKNLTLALSGIYTGTMLLQHFGPDTEDDKEVWSPRFFDLNLKISRDFKIGNSTRLQANAGIQNIFNSFQKDFDVGETRDAGYIYGPSLPRSFFAGVKLML